jgi:hypothetical protein
MSQIMIFQFEAPKSVDSGSSVGLAVSLQIDAPPNVLQLTPTHGYTCSPNEVTYTAGGVVNEVIPLLVQGPPGFCALHGKLALSEADDAVVVK